MTYDHRNKEKMVDFKMSNCNTAHPDIFLPLGISYSGREKLSNKKNFETSFHVYPRI
jgi:hypothetical protein